MRAGLGHYAVAALFLSFSLLTVPAPVSAATVAATPATLEAVPGTVAGSVADVWAAEGAVATVSEEDVTANLNAVVLLTPSSDTGPNDWLHSGPQGVCDTGAHFGCLAQPGEPDGNTTYLAMVVIGTESYALTPNLVPLDSTVTSVASFVHARKNQTAEETYLAYAVDVGGICDNLATALTQAYENRTVAHAVSCDGATPWTPALVNAMGFALSATLIAAPVDPWAATYAGAVVQYDDRDFQVRAFINFTQIPDGSQATLAFKGTHSLVAETLSLQSLRGATWVTVLDSFLGGGDVLTRLDLIAEDHFAFGAPAYFRVVDSVSDDEAGEAFTLDLFVIEVETATAGPGRRYDFDCFHFSILIGMWCTDRSAYLPGQAVLRVEWHIDGVRVAESPPGGTSWLWTPEGWFAFGSMNVTVGMRVVFDAPGGGGPLVVKTLTLFNWPRAVVTVVLPVAAVVFAYKRRYIMSGAR